MTAVPDATWRELAALVADAPPMFADGNFPQQAAFVEDDEPEAIALLCTRRAGKSTGIVRRILRDGWGHPRANYLYAGITLESARLSVWRDVFTELNESMQLGLKPNETHNTWTFPNGAMVYVVGMDKPEQIRKARGGKFRGIVADEAQDWGPATLLDFVVRVAMPALTDQRGWLVMAGTPGPVPKGVFYDLTGDLDPALAPVGWKDHKGTAVRWRLRGWNTHMNPGMRLEIARKLAAMIAVNPRIVETPDYKRERLGLWERGEQNIVYRYERNRNDMEGALPVFEDRRGSWHRVLGVDLGWEDATAFVVVAYHDFDRVLYVERAEKESHLDITATADRIRHLRAQYDFDSLVIDGANKQAVEEMRRRHSLPLTAADKRDKAEFIDMMNAEFIGGNIRLVSGCDALCKEYGGLVWDPRRLEAGKRVEHPACENHLSDACLYAWRHCYQYMVEQPQRVARPGEPEYEKELERKAIEQVEAQLRRERPEEGADPLERVLSMEQPEAAWMPW